MTHNLGLGLDYVRDEHCVRAKAGLWPTLVTDLNSPIPGSGPLSLWSKTDGAVIGRATILGDQN